MHSSPPRFWAVEEVTGVGLLEAIEPFNDALDVRWWLFPETQLRQGEVCRRPFHAKLVAVCTLEKGAPVTHVLVGCPNFDRSGSDAARLFEIGMHLRINRHLSATDLCAELVPAPEQSFFLEDRSSLPAEPDAQPPLERATYDARSRALVMEWQHRAPECRVTYQREEGEQELLKGHPRLRTTVPEFILGHESAELAVQWAERQAFVPITIVNVSCLRADEPEHELSLREHIRIHSAHRRVAQTDRSLNAHLVFKAQQALADLLSSTGLLLGAFEVAMDGPAGLRKYADCLLNSEDCQGSEAWLYGLELCKLLRGLTWHADPFKTEKRRIVDQFVNELQVRLRALAPKEPGSADVVRFYGGDA
jgi:hypothetical protein